MASNSFKIKNSLVLTPKDLSTLTSPEAGDLACDINDNNKIKRYDAASASWVEVGSGGVGGVDILFVQDFESASLSSFTQTGLFLSQTDPLRGKVSARLTHQLAINQSFKQVIPVDTKFRGQTMTLSLDCRSTASQGNLVINIKDETNNVDLVASEQLQLSSDISGAKSFVGFTIPSTCQSISYTITALPQAGGVTSRIDDIICQLAETALLETAVEVPNVTAWQGYTPTFQGFGTPTNVEFEWRQVGENVEIRGKFTAGVSTAVEARVGLPAGLTSAGTSLIPSLSLVGKGNRGSGGTQFFGGLTFLAEPSVSYITISLEASSIFGVTKQNGSTVASSGEVVTLLASVPCSGLSATTTKTIPLTQSGLVQQSDSAIQVYGGAFGSTNTRILRFSTVGLNLGDAIQYNPSLTLGDSFTALKSGIYEIQLVAKPTAISQVGIVKNAVTTGSITNDPKLLANVEAPAANYEVTCSASVYLEVGDVIRAYTATGGLTDSNSRSCQFQMTYRGSLKQVSVSSDQKITIPTSELRMEGASSRGSTATAIVRFDSVAKLRGDAFTVESDSVLGTRITMKKAGRLSISSSLYSSSANETRISLNQSILTANPTAVESLAAFGNAAGSVNASSGSWTGSVNVGDIVRVSSTAAPSVSSLNNLSLSFQEQDISVSVTNTLPQFSESDSSVRVDTANGYGSTSGNRIRRFSNVRDNIGTDIEYQDSSADGARFVVKSAGIYHISYSGSQDGSQQYIGISKNSTQLTTSIVSINVADRLAQQYLSGAAGEDANCSWQGYLQAGDVIRPHTDGIVNSTRAARETFTISKVGKPSVTGVDVTPFVNVPQQDTQAITGSSSTSFNNATVIFSSLSQSASAPLSHSNGVFTALKKCTVNASFSASAGGAATVNLRIRKNGNDISSSTTIASGGAWAECSASLDLNTGETISFHVLSNASNAQSVSILATAASDSIITANESFSTDTAQLTWAPLSSYTLSTLQNAPVGTYITFTYAANTNTRAQTGATRPAQTDADMNVNGIQVFTRAYNATSLATQPACIAIQIGKGMKGVSLGLYKSAGKVTGGELDFYILGNSNEYGVVYKNYNELTGILIVDLGFAFNGSLNTIKRLMFSDTSEATSGYLVINASKNASLTGLNIERVSARGVQSSGQSIGNTLTLVNLDATKTFDTHGALASTTAVFTAPEAGYYSVSSGISFASSSWTVGQSSGLALYKNGVLYSYLDERVFNASVTQQVDLRGSDVIYLAKGDTASIYGIATRGATSLVAGGVYNYFAISKTNIGGKN